MEKLKIEKNAAIPPSAKYVSFNFAMSIVTYFENILPEQESPVIYLSETDNRTEKFLFIFMAFLLKAVFGQF